MQLSFGPGVMWGERTDTTGSGIGPRQFGLMQDVDITLAFTSKELYGQEQFPAALARGQGKVTGKAKLARINVRLYSDIFFGLTAAAGEQTVSQYEAATIPAVPPFQVAVANNPTFADDLGVFYATSGDAFNRVTTPVNAGEYTVNLSNGVYTFASPDAAQAVRISYRYNLASVGFQVSVTNQVQGTTPYFKATIFQKVSPGAPGVGGQSLPWMIYLPACHSNSLSIPTTQDNWTMNAFDFSAFADPSGLVMTYNAVKQ
jgi:hypothetical protein